MIGLNIRDRWKDPDNTVIGEKIRGIVKKWMITELGTIDERNKKGEKIRGNKSKKLLKSRWKDRGHRWKALGQ